MADNQTNLNEVVASKLTLTDTSIVKADLTKLAAATLADLQKLNAITKSAAQINLLVAGVAAGYKLARGLATTVAASDDINTGLTSVIAAGASLEDDPSLDILWVQSVVGNQAGAPAAGHILLKSWKPTSNLDTTPIATAVFGKKISWWAIGT